MFKVFFTVWVSLHAFHSHSLEKQYSFKMSQLGNGNKNNNSNSDSNSTDSSSDKAAVSSTISESGIVENIPKLVPVDSTAIWDYLKPRIISSVVAGSIGGATAGYYIGDKTAIYFYKYGFATGMLGASFFTISYTTRHFREKEDIWNYTASAAITLGALNFPSGYKAGLQGVALGMVLGSAYWVSSRWLFEKSRSAWLQNRRHILQHSIDRTPKDNRPKIDRSEILLRSKQKQAADSSDKKFGFFFRIEKPNHLDPQGKWINASEKSPAAATPSNGNDTDGPEKKT